MLGLNDILGVSERARWETPFFSEKRKYIDYYKKVKRGTPGLDAWLVKNPYLTLSELMILIDTPIEAGRRIWFQPGHVTLRGCFSNKPGLRKIFRKL